MKEFRAFARLPALFMQGLEQRASQAIPAFALYGNVSKPAADTFRGMLEDS